MLLNGAVTPRPTAMAKTRNAFEEIVFTCVCFSMASLTELGGCLVGFSCDIVGKHLQYKISAIWIGGILLCIKLNFAGDSLRFPVFSAFKVICQRMHKVGTAYSILCYIFPNVNTYMQYLATVATLGRVFVSQWLLTVQVELRAAGKGDVPNREVSSSHCSRCCASLYKFHLYRNSCLSSLIDLSVINIE